jgi:heterodisulfide reductase subunit A
MTHVIRIGVFICHCGTNIGGFLDVSSLVDNIRQLPDVILCTDHLYTCSESGLLTIKQAIQDHHLNRVVVASCTPRTHEALFRNICKEAGLNPYLFEFVNIRDQCSWVHMHEPDAATIKAKDLIRMGVARARLLEPQDEISIDILPSALVIGGGITGMTCAVNLANQGFSVLLLEKEAELGGLLTQINTLAPTFDSASQLLEEKTKEVKQTSNLDIRTHATITAIHGYYGNYHVTFNQNGRSNEYSTGVIVLATGAQELKPIGEYGYNQKTVITQLELEHHLKTQSCTANTVVMIQCVGARNEVREYCSRICCINALKNAQIILQQNPQATVYILYRDMQSYGALETLYRKTRELGAIFIPYTIQKPPRVTSERIIVFDEFLSQEIAIQYDLVVLSTPLIPHPESKQLAHTLKIPTDSHGFFLEAHAKLRPLDFATDGIYLCGSARWPSTIGESISQALGAASRAAIPLKKGRVVTEPLISVVDITRCIGCGLCEAVCPYNAIRVEETSQGNIAQTIPASCRGCGVCGAACPQMAITMQHYHDDQICAAINALVEEIS